jgi:hypothetical protein
MREDNRTTFLIEQLQPTWLSNTKQRAFYNHLVGFITYVLTIFIIGLLLGMFSSVIQVIFLGSLLGSVTYLVVLNRSSKKDIQPVEVLRWSWAKFRRGLRTVLAWSLFVGGTVGTLNGIANGYINGIGLGMTYVVAAVTLGSIYKGIVADEHTSKNRPNEGVIRSAKNAVIGGGICVIGYGIPYGLIASLDAGLVRGLLSGAINGLVVGALAWLVAYGGLAVIQHIALRLVLKFTGAVPLHYARFLDHAAERILLRKVGGGYIFVHRMLLEYFAGLETEPQRKAESEAAQ